VTHAFPVSRGGAIVRQRGFTLVELAVVIVIIALVIGSILVPLGTQVEQRRIAEAQKQLEEIKEALVGYALAQTAPFLPCPDRANGATTTGLNGVINSANDGIEDVATTGACEDREGNLPWATLGIASADPWGNRYRYRPSAEFAQRPPAASFGLATQSGAAPNGVVVCATAACTSLLTVTLPSANAPVAVILSHGPNGFGAVNAETAVPSVTPLMRENPVSNDEIENASGFGPAAAGVFVSRAPSPRDAAAGEFDDIVTWLSPHTLRNRMVAAGRL